MRAELSKISQDLEQGTITEDEAQTLLLGLLGVSTRRELFDKFYEWLDGLSQAEYDDMSLTDKCEKFFFKT